MRRHHRVLAGPAPAAPVTPDASVDRPVTAAGSPPPARGAGRALRRGASVLGGAALVAAALVAPAGPATADTAPTEPGNPATVAADGLPTVQIDGVAWSQVVVGRTVYVAGKFSTARPAGAAPGKATIARANLLAYDLKTGALVRTWAPRLNGAAYVIAASPDGSRLFVGGDFTAVNGVAHPRFVALDPLTGKRVRGFAVSRPNAAVKALTVTASRVYLGGTFNAVAGTPRKRLAAVSARTGGLLPWKAAADLNVEALTVSPDGTRLIVGGRFQSLNGVQARGSGALSTSTGAVLPWAANKLVTNYGWDAGITSLSTDGTLVYGSGFAYLGNAGGYGNLEGVFAADPATGAIRWVEDCHGDTYSVYPNRGKDLVYAVGHAHFCGNIGGFAETSWRSALAFTKQDVMTITPNRGGKYFNFAGQRAPRLLHFYPHLKPGTATRARQAAWHVTGRSGYVVMAGEFTAVNGRPQQGLVRLGPSTVAPNALGPVVGGSALQPVATSRAEGTAQVSWATSWDRDNASLTYRVLRDGASTPVHVTTAVSTFDQRPRLSFTDTGLTPGRTYTYKVVVRDPFGKQAASSSVSVVAAGTSQGTLGRYAREVLGDDPQGYWRLGEPGGVARDWTGYADLTVGAATVRRVPGALADDPDGAIRLDGTDSARLHGGKASFGLHRVSVEAWFRTDATTGGTVVGFGSSSTAAGSTVVDRHLYVDADGRLSFGADPNSRRVLTTPTAVNDGRWHHAVATLGPEGMRLYLDGVLQAERADTISAWVGTGFWRIGGDRLTGWPAAGAQNFVGEIDEVAVYGRALTAAEVASHHAVGAPAPADPTPAPSDPAPTDPAVTDPGVIDGASTSAP